LGKRDDGGGASFPKTGTSKKEKNFGQLSNYTLKKPKKGNQNHTFTHLMKTKPKSKGVKKGSVKFFESKRKMFARFTKRSQ